MSGFDRCKLGAHLVLLLACCGSALAGERVALEGSGATVEIPPGWANAFVDSDPPMVVLRACDPAMKDGCLVMAEMTLENLKGERAPASLDAVFRDASVVSAVNPVPAQWIKVAGHDAVETVVLGDVNYNYGGGKGDTAAMAYRMLTLQVGSSFYRCGVSASPKQDPARWRPALIEFCSSLQFADAKRPIGKK